MRNRKPQRLSGSVQARCCVRRRPGARQVELEMCNGSNGVGCGFTITQVENRRADFRNRLVKEVIHPFSIATGETAIIANVESSGPDDDPGPNAGHSLCAAHANSNYCREACQLHLAVLNQRPCAYWHRCPHGLFFAVLPVGGNGHCARLLLKLVCASATEEQRFRSLVDVLDGLTRRVRVPDVSLSRTLSERESLALPGTAHSVGVIRTTAGGTTNPLVRLAVQFVRQKLAQPDLSVHEVAQSLDVNRSYLSHLFAKEVGRSLRRFILEERIERAKELLATTGLQIKQICFEAGFSNRSWFAHVFRTQTGVTPQDYRTRFLQFIA